MLSRCGTVDCYYDETWRDGKIADWVLNFEPEAYDAIVIWQAHECFKYVGSHPNVTFVPMYDAMRCNGGFYWCDEFSRAKILSFSAALHTEVQGQGARSLYCQYYPQASQYQTVKSYDKPELFYWKRRDEISDSSLVKLFRNISLERFTLHAVRDPSIPTDASVPTLKANIVDRTYWFENRQHYLDTLAGHNLYMAPRLYEGIGMGFLEAMAMGMCVVAPHTPTHNEYISSGTNGILYDPHRPRPVDMTPGLRELGMRARETVARGYDRWNSVKGGLDDFVMTPSAAGAPSGFMCLGSLPATEIQPIPQSVAVVTVCFNAATELERTMRSVLEQRGVQLEYVVLDGGSTDGTLEIIGKYRDALAFFQSGPDGGVYDAMNRAICNVKCLWTLFLNAGDTFSSSDAVYRLLRHAPPAASVVFGHHIYRSTEGIDELRRATEFSETWRRLLAGDLDLNWLSGVPGHQATAVRTEWLRKLQFDVSLAITADHDLLFRAAEQGATFFNSDELVSVYCGGGMSARRFFRCMREWAVVAVRHGQLFGALRFYVSSGLSGAAPPNIIDPDVNWLPAYLPFPCCMARLL